MISLSDLQDALSEIEAVVKFEHKFKVSNTLFVLTPLGTEDDSAVLEYATSAFEGIDQEDLTMADESRYHVQLMLGTISRACVQIGNLDFRNEEEIATGKILDGGVPEKVPRHVAIRELLAKYPRPVIQEIFGQSLKMIEIFEEATQNTIKWEPSDLEAEVERIEGRIEYVKMQVEQRKNPPPDILRRLQEAAGALAESIEGSKETLMGNQRVEDSRSEETTPVEPPMAPEPTPERSTPLPERPPVPTTPPTMTERPMPAPPSRQPPPMQQPPPREAAPMPQAPQASVQTASQENAEQRFQRENPDVQPQDRGLYTESGNSLLGDDMEAEIEREGQRQAQLHQQRLRRQAAASQPQPPQPSQGLPHQSARNASEELGRGEFIRDGLPEGVEEAYSFSSSTEVLSDREMVPEPPKRVTVNEVSRGTENPRFKAGRRVRGG